MTRYEKYGDRISAQQKVSRAKNKARVIDHYGGRCELCGINDPEVMTVDHLWGNGHDHRKEVGTRIHAWLIRNNFPPGFRLLCFNCNYKAHQARVQSDVIPLSLGTLQREISKWADINFPGRDAISVHNKLKQEMEEWAKNPDDAEEFADVMILVLDWMQLKGINAQAAINAKMGVNIKRNWVFDSTNRTWQHTEDKHV